MFVVAAFVTSQQFATPDFVLTEHAANCIYSTYKEVVHIKTAECYWWNILSN